jgi:trimeric autotransporter adhesin
MNKKPFKIVCLLIMLTFLISSIAYAIVYEQQTNRITQTITHRLKTDAFIAYRDSTTSLNTPKGRTWTGETATWGSQIEMPTANSPVRFVRVAYSTIVQNSSVKIVVTLSDDGYLDAYVWNGTNWSVANNIANPGTTANAYRCYDIVYENTTGNALLVYSRGTTTNQIGYKIWTSATGWSNEYLLNNAYTTGIAYWVSLASKAGANKIAMIYIDANKDVQGYEWTGSSWSLMGATAVWDTGAGTATTEAIAVRYETNSGDALFVWASSANKVKWRTWDGTTLGAVTTQNVNSGIGNNVNWLSLKANPVSTSNAMFLVVVSNKNDFTTDYWSGSAWAAFVEQDTGVDAIAARCADFAWEPTGSKGLLVWGTTAGKIDYKTFTAPNTFGADTPITMGSNTHLWVQLRVNPRSVTGDVMILGAVLEGTTNDIGAIKWDGTNFSVIGTNTISSDTTVTTYECFELKFKNF